MKLQRTSLVLTLVAECLLATGCGQSRPSVPPANMQLVTKLRETGTVAAAGAGATTAASTGTGWGTIKGRFTFTGTVPTPAKIDVNKDVEVCGKHNLADESLVVGSTGGLANVAIYLRNNKPRVHPDAGKELPLKVVYDNKGCRFEPHVLGVALTQTLVIKNSDPLGHNSNGSPSGDQAFNPLIPSGGEYEHKFARAQIKGVPVTCSIHPWMKGYILPRDNPYFAVTKDDGSFEIKNVPAGEELEFQLWHERADNGLEVDSSWAKGRKKLKVDADKTLDLGEIKVAPTALK